MKKIIPIVLFLLSFIPMGLMASEVTVTVSDRELEIPMEGVQVVVPGIEDRFYTDQNGMAVVRIPDSLPRVMVSLSLPGYENQRTALEPGSGTVQVFMNLAGVVEGKELVVERKAPGKSDAKSGVSQVMESREMKTTAQIGLVEDIMASINTLPGITYSGGWDNAPSIRGGSPDEMAALLDGVYVIFPYHWGGAYSIFNPLMVESAKLSHGVFSSRYGRAMSGVLEVTTITPDEPRLRLDGGIGTTSTDLFAQIPLGSRSGLSLGGKLTYLEPMVWLAQQITEDAASISTASYIRDFYGKWFIRPVSGLEIYTNVFIGTDGVGSDTTSENEGVTTHGVFDYTNFFGFGAGGVHWIVNDRFRLNFSGAYSRLNMDLEFEQSFSGSKDYSSSFLADNDLLDGVSDGQIFGKTSYNLSGLSEEGSSSNILQQTQGKIEGDLDLGKSNLLTLGAEEVFSFTQLKQDFNTWQTIIENGNPTFEQIHYNIDVNGNRVLNTAAYAAWTFG